jgi:DNA-binding beta-propeller fold protein YncE
VAVTVLASPGAALAWTGQPLAYVVPSNNTITVIDTGDNRVVDTIQLGSPAGGLAVSPDGRFVYLANGSVIETAKDSDTLIAPLPVDGNLAVSSDGNNVYVCTGSNLSVINSTTNGHKPLTGTQPKGILPGSRARTN